MLYLEASFLNSLELPWCVTEGLSAITMELAIP